MKRIGLIVAIAVVSVSVSAGSLVAPSGRTPVTVPSTELDRMLQEQREAEAMCHPLMPVYAWDDEGNGYIDCREPMEGWSSGQAD